MIAPTSPSDFESVNVLIYSLHCNLLKVFRNVKSKAYEKKLRIHYIPGCIR